MRVDVLNGVNLDVLEKRDPAIYGGVSLRELEQRIAAWAETVTNSSSVWTLAVRGGYVGPTFGGEVQKAVHGLMRDLSGETTPRTPQRWRTA